MVLAYAAVEGSANDWLSLGIVDGYHQPHWVGVSGFALFVVCMTLGRLVGPLALQVGPDAAAAEDVEAAPVEPALVVAPPEDPLLEHPATSPSRATLAAPTTP